jgi:lipopolysaccharide/colanic/teichoic acid biosynthesis glycosyltransferase
MSTASGEIYQPLVWSRSWDQPFQLACKRLLDVVLSAFLLVLASPLFLVLGLAVKLTSPGPVLSAGMGVHSLATRFALWW